MVVRRWEDVGISINYSFLELAFPHQPTPTDEQAETGDLLENLRKAAALVGCQATASSHSRCFKPHSCHELASYKPSRRRRNLELCCSLFVYFLHRCTFVHHHQTFDNSSYLAIILGHTNASFACSNFINRQTPNRKSLVEYTREQTDPTVCGCSKWHLKMVCSHRATAIQMASLAPMPQWKVLQSR